MKKLLADCKVGDKILHNGIPAQLVAQDATDNMFLVGSMDELTNAASGGLTRSSMAHYILIENNPATRECYRLLVETTNYQCGWWWSVNRGLMVEVVDATPSKPVSCKKCKNYNEYAIPNQDDGTFICYSCRGS